MDGVCVFPFWVPVFLYREQELKEVKASCLYRKLGRLEGKLERSHAVLPEIGAVGDQVRAHGVLANWLTDRNNVVSSVRDERT